MNKTLNIYELLAYCIRFLTQPSSGKETSRPFIGLAGLAANLSHKPEAKSSELYISLHFSFPKGLVNVLCTTEFIV